MTEGKLRSFGRRRGRKLSKTRGKLLDAALPSLRLGLPADGKAADLKGLFSAGVKDIWLEVGFGGGEHLASQAKANPHIGMIGCEPFVNGVASLLARVNQLHLQNVRIFDDDARRLFDALPGASIGRMFVLFADPWPKKRHHERRFINDECLDSIARLLKDGALFRFASDHMEYARWTLWHFLRHPCFQWTAETAKDWRNRGAGWFATRYEEKALAQGKPCVYLQFKRRFRCEAMDKASEMPCL